MTHNKIVQPSTRRHHSLVERSPSWEAATQELRRILWDGMDWIDLWRAIVNMVMNLQVPSSLSKIHFNIVHPPTSWSS
jgi:hypothetical protein